MCLAFSLSDDNDEDDRPVTGLIPTAELFGEKPENMIPLPIIKREPHQVVSKCICTMCMYILCMLSLVSTCALKVPETCLRCL